MGDLHSQLVNVLPDHKIRTRLIDRIAYANDASYFRLVPQAVVRPDSIDEIQALFRFSRQSHGDLTFRAAGTSLSGQAVTEGLLVDISKNWSKYRLENDGNLIRFQPGIVGGFLNNVLKPLHRRIGPDPASIDAAMMGGILANNSSGMCCGVTENSYRTIHSMTIVLPNGFCLDTGAADASEQLRLGAPQIVDGLMDLKKRLLSTPADPSRPGETLAQRVRRRYLTKNNNGYSLNAFLDFDTPIDILTHLMIGSEGTLGYIAEAVLHTLPDFSHKYTGQLYFKNIQDAANAIAPLRDSGARAAEIMDRASLRSVQSVPGAPEVLSGLPDGAAAILVEYQAGDADTMAHFEKEAARVLKGLRLLHDAEFTDDPVRQAALWKPRKGIIASVGAMRAPGTTSVNEDVAFPFQHLAGAVTDLRHLFDAHGYPEGVIFGHAKDGNLHFLVNQAFETPDDLQHFDAFVQEVVKIVSGKYDGALKAEHGTGRNMAPFVETEWGAQAYAIMRDLKSLFDPDGILSPGVLINSDPQAHIKNLKTSSPVGPEVDKCIECGFCEPKCPSRQLTLTPRQRIVVQREISRLRAVGSKQEVSALVDDFRYAGIETCAVDGLCATACPVSINTGDLIKKLRAESVKDEKPARWIVDHFSLVEKGLGWGVRLGHTAERLFNVKGVRSISLVTEKMTGITLPKWNDSIPHVPSSLVFRTNPGNLASASLLPASTHPDQKSGVYQNKSIEQGFIYFPSCISRQLGLPKPSDGDQKKSLAETLITVSNRAQIKLAIPADVEGHCCGMPFGSKGYKTAYKAALHKTVTSMWGWSQQGKIPIVIDTTSCLQTLRTCGAVLDGDDKGKWESMTLLDSIEFIHDILLPRLILHPVEKMVMLHPNCSARKLGLDGKLVSIARQCAKAANIPLDLGCCAFAGDRGLLFPELTASATEKEAAEVNSHAWDGYYSSNITCEMGMSTVTGKQYVGIVYLVEEASR